MELGGRAFDVLVALIEAQGAVVSKDEPKSSSSGSVHRRFQLGNGGAAKWRPLSANDIAVLGVVALNEDPLTCPTAHLRGPRRVRRHIAVSSADERDYCVDWVGTVEADLSPSLAPQSKS